MTGRERRGDGGFGARKNVGAQGEDDGARSEEEMRLPYENGDFHIRNATARSCGNPERRSGGEQKNPVPLFPLSGDSSGRERAPDSQRTEKGDRNAPVSFQLISVGPFRSRRILLVDVSAASELRSADV